MTQELLVKVLQRAAEYADSTEIDSCWCCIDRAVRSMRFTRLDTAANLRREAMAVVNDCFAERRGAHFRFDEPSERTLGLLFASLTLE